MSAMTSIGRAEWRECCEHRHSPRWRGGKVPLKFLFTLGLAAAADLGQARWARELQRLRSWITRPLPEVTREVMAEVQKIVMVLEGLTPRREKAVMCQKGVFCPTPLMPSMTERGWGKIPRRLNRFVHRPSWCCSS